MLTREQLDSELRRTAPTPRRDRVRFVALVVLAYGPPAWLIATLGGVL